MGNRYMASIKLNWLSKKYNNGYEAVKNVTFEIADKEFIVIVGPSDCGKTSLFRMITGLEDITNTHEQIVSREDWQKCYDMIQSLGPDAQKKAKYYRLRACWYAQIVAIKCVTIIHTTH